MGHEHGHHHATGSGRRLAWSFALTLAFTVVEAVGGWLTNSLALLSDAGHMLTDTGALGLGLLALRFAARPPSTTKTFGYRRIEILAALINGLTLWAVVGVILHEAWIRLQAPPDLSARGLMVVASLGLLVNLAAIAMLRRHRRENLNIRGAFLHVVADSLGSVAALTAGIVIYYTGWRILDPAVSLVICGLILWSSWSLLSDAVHALLLGVPAHLDYREIEADLLAQEGVCCIYDLHIWSISSGREALSAHLVVPEGFRDTARLLRRLVDRLRSTFGLEHVTLQIEESHALRDSRGALCCPSRGQEGGCRYPPCRKSHPDPVESARREGL